MDLAEHFRIIWRRRLWIVLASLLAAAAVYALQAQQDDVYVSFSQLRVTTGEEAEGKPPDKQGTIFLAQQYAELVESTVVLARTVELSGLDIGRGDAASRTSASVSGTVGRITIRTTGPSPEAARALNNAAAAALVEAVAEVQQRLLEDALAPLEAEILQLEQQLAQFDVEDELNRDFIERQILQRQQDISNRRGQAPNQVTLLNEAFARQEPIAPKPQRDALLALIVALIVTAELAVAFTIYGDRIDSEEDVTRLLGARDIPVLGRIPDGPYDANAIESFRELRTALLFLRQPGQQMRLAVVGAQRGVGKSYVAMRTAESISAADQHTLLVDSDLRAPTLHERLGLARSPGLTQAVSDPSVAPSLHAVTPHLRVLTAGDPVEDPAGMLASSHFDEAIQRVGDVEVMVFDTPPLLLFADPLSVSARCSGVLLVVDVPSTRRSRIESALSRLDQIGIRPIGAVLNRATVVDRRYYSR